MGHEEQVGQLPPLANSLAPECNQSKHDYDTCFNMWFKSYLALVTPQPDSPAAQQAQQSRIAEKRKEYEKNCGGAYRKYQECLNAAIGNSESLREMLEPVRANEPLESFDKVRIVKPEDLDE